MVTLNPTQVPVEGVPCDILVIVKYSRVVSLTFDQIYIIACWYIIALHIDRSRLMAFYESRKQSISTTGIIYSHDIMIEP